MKKLFILFIAGCCLQTMKAQITYKQISDSLKELENTTQFHKLKNCAEILECQQLQDSIFYDMDDYIQELEEELDKLDILLLLTDSTNRVFADSTNYDIQQADVPLCLLDNYKCIVNIRKAIRILNPIEDIIRNVEADENMAHIPSDVKKGVLRNRIEMILQEADVVFNLIDEQIDRTTLSPVQKEFYRPGLTERINHYYELIEE